MQIDYFSIYSFNRSLFSISKLGPIDGLNMWNSISKDEPSPRTSTLHNIDDILGSSALTVDKWKLINGTNYKGEYDGWFGPSGDRNPETYSYNELRQSNTGERLLSMGLLPSKLEVMDLRAENSVDCYSSAIQNTICKPLKEPCLFNIEEDPCELNNLAGTHPNELNKLLEELEKFRASAVPPNNKDLDHRGEPKNFHYVWTNFGDEL